MILVILILYVRVWLFMRSENLSKTLPLSAVLSGDHNIYTQQRNNVARALIVYPLAAMLLW